LDIHSLAEEIVRGAPKKRFAGDRNVRKSFRLSSWLPDEIEEVSFPISTLILHKVEA
jgi:hypothetical protein